MPFEPGGGGAGGGTVSDICTVSPSDQVGAINNLVSRIEELEKTVSELMSANVSANQLSDLSRQAGWITGVTYLGVAGWTQTPAGTLIPPAGWTGLSSVIDGFQGTMYNGGGSRPCLHRKHAAASGPDFSGSYFVTLATTPAADDDATFAGTNYLSPGTDGAGNAGWQVLVSGVYRFSGWVEIAGGTSAPTSGLINAKLYKRDTIYRSFCILGTGIPVGGLPSASPMDFPLYGEIQLDAGNYVNLNIANSSDGDVYVSNGELIGTLLRTT